MFLNIETAIVDQLRYNIDDSIQILTQDDLSGMEESSQPCPAVHVIYSGYRVIETRDDGKISHVQQRWLAVVATRNMRSRRSAEQARQDALPILDEVKNCLMGFWPDQASSPLRLATPPLGGGENGFHYEPLAFDVNTILKTTSRS